VEPTIVSALISLPPLPAETALVASAVVLLLATIVAARAVLASQGLARRAAEARRRRARVVDIEAGLHADLDGVRARLQQLNVEAERALWLLPSLDERMTRLSTQLRSTRAAAEALTRDEAEQMRTTFARIRGTLNVLHGMRELRRTILG
jgi:hypothetical protein